MLDITKENFRNFEICKDDYGRGLTISKDEDLELHLENQRRFCCLHNYYDGGLKLERQI